MTTLPTLTLEEALAIWFYNPSEGSRKLPPEIIDKAKEVYLEKLREIVGRFEKQEK